MRSLHELNINAGGTAVTRSPPTDTQISRFESHFRIALPKEYLALLRHSNGGHPERDAFKPKGLKSDAFWGVNHFYFLNDDRDNVGCLWCATNSWRSAIGGNVVPIAEDGGGNQILLCFDDAPATVRLCIHDEGMRTVLVANSFPEFIDMLSDDPEMI